MREFDDAYWLGVRTRLTEPATTPHVHYARFVADHQAHELKHVTNVGWHRWNGKVWAKTGDAGAAYQAMTAAARVLVLKYGAGADWAKKPSDVLHTHYERRAILQEMIALEQFRLDVNELDTHRHLLTFQNGTVDLRSGEFIDGRFDPDLLLTQITNVDYVPTATAPRFERFVHEIFPDDAELRSYYLRFLGLCITGEVRDHALGVWYGHHGRNGKGATVRTMQAVFGQQIIKDVHFSTFENVRGQQVHTEVIAGMRGARMIVAQEGNPETPMNTSLLKTLSGGDAVPARHLQGATFTYQPTFTIVLATNHLPQFSAGGAALWARTKAILFDQSFADRVDQDLEPVMQGHEREGIAAAIVRGAMAYYSDGLKDPESVRKATQFHRDSVDPLKELVGELFDYAEDMAVQRRDFNAALKVWRDENGDKSAKFSPSSVKRQLIDSGKVNEIRTRRDGWVYQGIGLMDAIRSKGVSPGPGIFAKD